MTTSTFLGIPHTGHDRTDEWVHKGKHWLEHEADKAGHEAEGVLDKGAAEIVDTAVAAIHAVLSTIGTDVIQALLNSLIDLAEHVAPDRSAEIPIIPFTVFTPGLELSLNIHDNLESLRKWAHHPPHGKDDYLAMLRDLADEEYVIVHLPNGVGKIPVKVGMIDQEIEKLL